MIKMMTTVCLPDYDDKIERIYSIIFMNIITLGGCSVISLFGLDDIILCLLFWFQIIAANNNQGFLNNVYTFKWRVIDIMGAFIICGYMFYHYGNIIPAFIAYPHYLILLIVAYSQSTSKSMNDYIKFVNIWHLLVLFTVILVVFFKYPHLFTNGDIILEKNISID